MYFTSWRKFAIVSAMLGMIAFRLKSRRNKKKWHLNRVQFSQDGIIYTPSEKPICTPPRLSEVSPVLTLIQFQYSSDWRWPSVILSRKIAERFLLIGWVYSIYGKWSGLRGKLEHVSIQFDGPCWFPIWTVGYLWHKYPLLHRYEWLYKGSRWLTWITES